MNRIFVKVTISHFAFRHYGLFLQQMKILPEGSVFQETNGAKLIQNGVKGLEDLLAELKKSGGGVVFVDEAYQLANDRDGKKVLDFILPLAESLHTEYGKLLEPGWFVRYRTTSYCTFTPSRLASVDICRLQETARDVI